MNYWSETVESSVVVAGAWFLYEKQIYGWFTVFHTLSDIVELQKAIHNADCSVQVL
jgi:hypothetical protein